MLACVLNFNIFATKSSFYLLVRIKGKVMCRDSWFFLQLRNVHKMKTVYHSLAGSVFFKERSEERLIFWGSCYLLGGTLFFGRFNSNFSLLKHQLCKVTMGLFYNSSQNSSSFPGSGALSRVGVQKSFTNSVPGKSRVLSSEN